MINTAPIIDKAQTNDTTARMGVFLLVKGSDGCRLDVLVILRSEKS